MLEFRSRLHPPISMNGRSSSVRDTARRGRHRCTACPREGARDRDPSAGPAGAGRRSDPGVRCAPLFQACPISRRRATQLKALRGRTHELHSAIALVRDGAVVFEHREVARLDHARLLRRVSRRLSRGDGVGCHRQRRRLPAREGRDPAVRANRGRSFRDSRAAACWHCCDIPAVRMLARELSCRLGYDATCSSSASPARSEWENRSRRASSPKRECRCTMLTPWCTASTRVRRWRRSRAAFPGTTVTSHGRQG